MTRLGRSLLREIAPLYAAGLSVLLLLLLVNFLLGVLADALARGAPVGLVARFLLFKLPGAASAGLTLALLFASLLALARMSADRELRAAMALGITPGAFLRPLLVAGASVTLIAAANNELVVPWAETRALETQKEILLQAPEAFLQEGAFFTDARGRSLFLSRLRAGGAAEGIVIIAPDGLGGPREVIEAQRGRLDEEAGAWRLEDLRIRVFDAGRPSLDMRAASGTVPVRDLTAATTSRPDLVTLPLPNLLQRIGAERTSPAAWTALHRKAAEPLAAVAFAVFALAVAMAGLRRNASLGMVSVLLLTFAYYATWSVAKLLGAQGTVPAWIAGWAPVSLYFLAGAVLLGAAWRR
ncbi:MAG: LptF/LptG family permease [Trueperaceae bacterium]|nr:LptF/LptG family permease [Trueperaceae bacterium]